MSKPSITSVVEALQLLFSSMANREFSKTLALHEWSEREMAPLARAFLLGRFGQVIPEVRAKLNTAKSGYGRIDFCLGDIGIELAVRRRTDSKRPLSDRVNEDEIQKLARWEGRALLVLFDFAAKPLARDDLERFREWKSFGPGSFKTSPFHVSHHYLEDGIPTARKLRIEW